MEKKFIASTMVYTNENLIDALLKIKANGFKGAEVVMNQAGTWGHFKPIGITEEEIQRIAKEVLSTGLSVTGLNVAGFDNVTGENEINMQSVKAMENVFRFAKALETEVVTVGCGAICEENRGARLKKIAEYNALLCDMATASGVTLSVEAPHKQSITSNYDELIEYWSYQREDIKCTFDAAHFTFMGIDAVKEAVKMKDRIAMVHLRDAALDNSNLPFGEGKIDFKGLFDALKDYKGYYSFELVSKDTKEGDEKLITALNYFKEM
ncbi:MAG: sugar phosphate isomerase/epimerase [Bacillota bacterium]|nr:sugar phosphate isomerase/epimerase [Bacillota bacterium]